MKRLRKEPPEALLSLRYYLLRFLIGAILSESQLFGGYAPFALGFVAAMGPGSGGLAALAGVLAGAALFMDFSRALRLCAVGILIFSAASTFIGTKLLRKPLFLPLLSAALMGVVEAVYLIADGAGLVTCAECVTAVALCGLSARYFPAKPDFSRAASPAERRAQLYLLSALLMALSGVPLPWGMSLGRILAGALTMLLAFQYGGSSGALAGLGLGLAMDLRGGGSTLFFTAAFALGGFFLGTRRESGRFIAATLYGLVVLFFLLPASAMSRVPLAEETLCAAALFLLTPLHRRGGKYLRPFSPEEKPSPALQLRQQLEQAALAFRELYDSFSRGGSGEESPSVLFDRVAEAVCGDCALCDVCWKKEYTSTFNAFNDATPALLRRGKAESGDFPPFFASRCIHFSEFLAELNTELTAFLLRRQYRVRLSEARSSAKGQYAQLSDLLAATAEQLPAKAVSVGRITPLAYQLGAATRPKQGEQVSGDSAVSFSDASGETLFLLLSDGMGCGAAAREESATAVRLLERFLKAGIQTEAALRTLNAAFSLRGAESGSFTTVDLLSLDLKSGDAALYKYGAAPSYLRQGGTVRRITGGSLPAGLESDGHLPEVTRFRMESGAFFVLLSDGLAETEEDRWLSALLKNWSGRNPQSLVSLLLAESLSHGGGSDDCAAMVLYLPPSESEV